MSPSELTKFHKEMTSIIETLHQIGGAAIYHPGPLLELEDLVRRMDPRIVTGKYPEIFRWEPGKAEVTSRSGFTGTARVYSWITPPCYSPDGRFAIVLTGEPSDHGASVDFVLERQHNTWTVVRVQTSFYL